MLPDGRSILTLVSAMPTRDRRGRTTGAVAIAQDMTHLEDREKQRNEFLSIVNHEVRGPLATIKGLSTMALGSRGGMSAADVQDFFGTIDKQADCMTELVNSLGQMTSIESGRLSVSPEPIDLLEVVEESVAAFGHSAARHITDVQSPRTLPRVMADHQRIGQVVTNLLRNAARFSPPQKPITIVIDAPARTGRVSVHVRDQGMGIPPEKMPLLFKKYSRLHDGEGSGLSGTGLGLAICKGIIEAHGGQIEASSAGRGHGTTISFTLPLASASPAMKASQPAEPEAVFHASAA